MRKTGGLPEPPLGQPDRFAAASSADSCLSSQPANAAALLLNRFYSGTLQAMPASDRTDDQVAWEPRFVVPARGRAGPATSILRPRAASA